MFTGELMFLFVDILATVICCVLALLNYIENHNNKKK